MSNFLRGSESLSENASISPWLYPIISLAGAVGLILLGLTIYDCRRGEASALRACFARIGNVASNCCSFFNSYGQDGSLVEMGENMLSPSINRSSYGVANSSPFNRGVENSLVPPSPNTSQFIDQEYSYYSSVYEM